MTELGLNSNSGKDAEEKPDNCSPAGAAALTLARHNTIFLLLENKAQDFVCWNL